MIIVFEGCDAAGKATQSRLLAEELQAPRIAFPRYHGPFGAAIQAHLQGTADFGTFQEEAPYWVPSPLSPLVLQALMTCDRYDAAPTIRDLASRGNVVLDRYWQSGYCYGRDDGLSDVLLLSVHQSLPQADVNIFIDLPIEEAARRRPEARDRYEADREKLERVRRRYLDLWSVMDVTEPGKWFVVDGRASVEEVRQQIRSVLAGRNSA